MYFLRNSRGYTFVEAIFQLIVMLLFAHLLVLIVLWFANFQNIEAMQEDVNWELFVLDVRQYMKGAHKLQVINNGEAIQFDMMDEGEWRTFIIEKSPTDHIRKRSRAGGNEIMYPYVKQLTFSIENNEIYMKLLLLNEQERERVFIVPKNE